MPCGSGRMGWTLVVAAFVALTSVCGGTNDCVRVCVCTHVAAPPRSSGLRQRSPLSTSRKAPMHSGAVNRANLSPRLLGLLSGRRHSYVELRMSCSAPCKQDTSSAVGTSVDRRSAPTPLALAPECGVRRWGTAGSASGSADGCGVSAFQGCSTPATSILPPKAITFGEIREQLKLRVAHAARECMGVLHAGMHAVGCRGYLLAARSTSANVWSSYVSSPTRARYSANVSTST